MTPEQFLEQARARKDWAWTFFHHMTRADKQAFDAWLVQICHPLAYEPGTTEMRFRLLAESR